MHTEKEIEFKNLLTKEEFNLLLNHFEIKPNDFKVQTNYYFDTPSNYFKENKIGFRLRVLPDRNELTMKVPEQEHVINETTQFITDLEKENILQNLSFPPVPFLEQLNLEEELICIGSMQTKRATSSYKNGILFFDHSLYSNTEDFEVEYECNNVEIGKEAFLYLLKTLQIPLRHADKKIARLVAYNKSKG